MKIAVYHDLPSGGAKRTLYESMKRLSRHHTLDVYTLDTSVKDFCDLSEFSNEEFVFHFSPSQLLPSPFGRLNQLLRWLDLHRLDRLARKIAAVIDAKKYDVVFAQPCMWTQAPLILRYLQTPTVYYCHEPPRHMYENTLKIRVTRSKFRMALDSIDPFIKLYRQTGCQFDKLATCAAKLVLVNSVFIRDQVKQIYGIDSVISYHGVDTDVFAPDSSNGTSPYVLSVGAIQPHKGFDFLIDSFSCIDKQFRPPLYLIGNMQNSSEYNRLRHLASEKNVDLHIEVDVGQNRLVEMYNGASLVAYAPYNEPFGLVPLEAMACGKAVIGVNEGGVKETVLDHVTGLLVERDSQKFGQAIRKLLDDHDLAAQYGKNGRNQVLKNWSWDKSAEHLEQYIQALVR